MRYVLLFVIFVSAVQATAQSNQLTINRVSQMPDMPSPYLMRDWKQVAVNYDQLVFSTTAATAGPYLPLVGIKPTGTNYTSLQPILLQTFVGTRSAGQAEGINIIPALVGASLMDINKASQNGVNWVEKSKDFFNRANGQNVYLNGYSANSGGDWWYDMMPNIFFYQLYTQYPSTSDYTTQFRSVADQWLGAVHKMGGKTAPWTVPYMNYRAWNLKTGKGLAEGVREPEAAGGIGWLLYHAYLETGEKKYLDGAQMSLEYLSALTSNPSYELQLPYGAFIAAKMNAEQGTSYDIEKIVNWCFDRGPLRGWGVIKGKWGDAGSQVDVSGLIGEANDGGNDYAFAMNGFQQAAALVPMIKYDKRFTRDIAKWTLNVANASRLFYGQYLTNHDDQAWLQTNDPNGVLAYEALKERDSHNSNKRLNGTGDAKRNNWAYTNLGLYGSSHVGYLGAVVQTTNVEGILQLDLNKTDFFLKDAYPSYALYNPYTEDKVVTISLPAGSHDIYDAISEITIANAVSGTTTITIKADEAVLLTCVPAGTPLIPSNGKLLGDNKIVDYHYGFDFTPKLRVKAIGVASTNVEYGQEVPVYLEVENADDEATYTWSDHLNDLGTLNEPEFSYTVPAVPGERTLIVTVTSNGQQAIDSIKLMVYETIPEPPVIESLTAPETWAPVSTEIVFTCTVTDDDDTIEELTFEWILNGTPVSGQTEATFAWQAPATEGVYELIVKATDTDGLMDSDTVTVLLKQPGGGTETPLVAYYPLDGNARDFSGNNRNGTLMNVDVTTDVRGLSGKAYLFNSGSDIISVPTDAGLNFTDKITSSFWVKANSLPDEETFVLSHGSYEDRWKISITPSKRLRWTVKTGSGTSDLDTSFPLVVEQFYHITVVYSGYSMEIYVDGELDTFKAFTGALGTTTKALTFGRMNVTEANYYLRGVLDEVRIYNAIVPPNEISTLKDKFNIITGVESAFERIQVYPNPAAENFFLTNTTVSLVKNMQLYDVSGRLLPFEAVQSDEDVKVSVNTSGLVILKITSGSQVYHRKIILK